MIKRIRQFWRAIKAKLTVEDKVFIDKYLNDEEQKLFFAMRVYDQRHVLNVAYTAQKIIEQNQSLMANHSTFILYLFKRFNLGIDDKIFFVLLLIVLPPLDKIISSLTFCGFQ